jgi:imidazolonepropionase-like amidohydrolase
MTCWRRGIGAYQLSVQPGTAMDPMRSRSPFSKRRRSVFMYDALPKAEAAGVRLLLGDDYGGVRLRHGDYGAELHTYVDDVGLSSLSVIKWATRHGAELIGRSDDLGTIAVGKIADLLVIDGDPSADIGLLADTNPVAVLKGGEVVSGALPG